MKTAVAVSGPRALKNPRSPDYAIQTMGSLKRYLQSRTLDAEGVQRELKEIETYEHWRILGFPSLDAYLRSETGYTRKALAKRLAEDLAKEAKALGHWGQDENSKAGVKKEENQDRQSTLGRASDYRVRRIARDRPDILERMKAGEFESVRAAAIEAGIVKVKSPLEQLRHWWAKASEAEREQFLIEP